MKHFKTLFISLVMLVSLTLTGCDDISQPSFDLDSIPPYAGDAYVVLNDNVPDFTAEDLTTSSYETYGRLDYLGRCTVASAVIGKDLMPTKERDSISHIKPTGWQYAKYDFIDGRYLYNRCHLIAYQLTGEDDNEQNLITGTRYMNTEMIEFEELVGNYVRKTGNHVRYRVTPIFEGTNPVASGIQMEGMSIEDEGEDIMFNVYFYNVQPGVEIDYTTGDNWLNQGGSSTSQEVGETTYILNTSSKKFHYSDCSGVKNMNKDNKAKFTGTRSELITAGYEPCGSCHP